MAKRELGKDGSPALLAEVFQRIDYRAVAFGAVLPDLIDKPIVWFILRDGDLGGQHVGHSILFSLVLLAAGLMVFALGEHRLLMLAFGAITHVLFDSVTHVPWSILYPFIDLDVPRNEIILGVTNIAAEVAAVITLFLVLKKPGVWKRISAFMREGDIRR